MFLRPVSREGGHYQGDTNVVKKQDVQIEFTICTTLDYNAILIKNHLLIHKIKLQNLKKCTFFTKHFIAYNYNILIFFLKFKVISEETSLNNSFSESTLECFSLISNMIRTEEKQSVFQ